MLDLRDIDVAPFVDAAEALLRAGRQHRSWIEAASSEVVGQTDAQLLIEGTRHWMTLKNRLEEHSIFFLSSGDRPPWSEWIASDARIAAFVALVEVMNEHDGYCVRDPKWYDRLAVAIDLLRDQQGPAEDVTNAAAQRPPSGLVSPPVAYGVILGGPNDPVNVDGKQKPALPTQQYRCVMLLIESYPAGIKLNEFPDTIGNPYHALKTLREDADFEREIIAPRRSGRGSPGYRLARPGCITSQLR